MCQVAFTPIVLYSHPLSLATPPVQAGAAREAGEHFSSESLTPTKFRDPSRDVPPEMSRSSTVSRGATESSRSRTSARTHASTPGPSSLVHASARRRTALLRPRRGLSNAVFFSNNSNVSAISPLTNRNEPCFLGFGRLDKDRTFPFAARNVAFRESTG